MKIQTLLQKRGRISWFAAALMTLVFFNFGMLSDPAVGSDNIIIKITFNIIAAISVFLIFYRNDSYKVRYILFSAMGILMTSWFITHFYLLRGHVGLSAEDVNEGIPFCHLAISNELLSVPILRMFTFPGNLTGGETAIYPMIIFWFWATILVGKGWCSWGCFYGGHDNLFSGIMKKPLVKIKPETSRKLRFLPYLYLIAMAVLSLGLFAPVFCEYLCPFKTVTEFLQVTTIRSWLIFLVSVGSFIGFCIILPLFFSKRTWCTYLCPFGAFQSLIGKVLGIFKVKINNEACIDCKKCVRACKTAGITEESLAKRKVTLNCSLCGECIDKCPKKAINITAVTGKTSPKALIEKATGFMANHKVLNAVRIQIVSLVDDLLTARTLFNFFALAVFFTFFTGFYYESIANIITIISGGAQ